MKPAFFFLFLSAPLFGQELPNFAAIAAQAAEGYGYQINQYLLVVQTGSQKIFLTKNGSVQKTFTVSTGMGGESSLTDSKGTPLGWHYIYMKIGEGEPIGRWIHYKTVTDKIIPIYTDKTRTDKDYLITRVMALAGLEEGKNKGGPEGIFDSFKRGINIHGTPEEGFLGTKASHGCIRMRNTEVVELYSLSPSNTLVYISP